MEIVSIEGRFVPSLGRLFTIQKGLDSNGSNFSVGVGSTGELTPETLGSILNLIESIFEEGLVIFIGDILAYPKDLLSAIHESRYNEFSELLEYSNMVFTTSLEN